MSRPPSLELRDEQPYLAIPTTARLSEWGTVNALIPEVLEALSEQHLAPAGPLFYRYQVTADADGPFTVEVGFPTARTARSAGRAHPGVIPAGRYATHLHVGHPDKLRASFAVLEQWIAEQGEAAENTTVGDECRWAGRFEFYLSDPEKEPDPNAWQIEVAWKLRDRPIS